MRIAQIAPLYESVPPKLYGGTERIVSYLTEELVAQGHKLTLFASGDSKTKARLVASCEEGLRLRKDCIDSLPYHIIQLQDVAERAAEFDILHFHADYLHFPLSGFMNYRHVSTLHGRLDLPDLKPLYKRFNEVPLVSISDNQRKPLAFANWVKTIYHGLPLNLYTPKTTEGNYFAFVGRFSPEKGAEQAIEIAKKTGIPILIAAKIDKADADYFEKNIKHLLDDPLVKFIGEVTEEEKEDFYGNALATLFPVNWPEPFGLVMIESMACGTPVIAFNKGSVPEVIDEGVSGYIVSTVDEAVKAVGNVHKIDRRQCRRRYEERFSAPIMAKNYLAVYEQADRQKKK
jgi:glycosyltransferase involved in cell wall biosynthesis